MKDITKTFFEEIYPKYKDISINKLENEQHLKFSGRVAVLAVRGKEKVRSLNHYISSYGFRPIVIEFEESLKLKGRIQKKLKNIDILISNPKGNPVHNFSGREKSYYEKSLGREGLLIHSRYSTKRLEPKRILEILFMYMNDNSDGFEHFFDSDQKLASSKNKIKFPMDIKQKKEFEEILRSFNFVKGVTDIRAINFDWNAKKSSDVNQKILFTFVHKDIFEVSELTKVKKQIDQIFKKYNRNDLKAKVQVVLENSFDLVAA